MESLNEIDVQLFRSINDGILVSALLDPVMLALSSQFFWSGVIVTIFVFAIYRRDSQWLKFVGCVALAIGISDFFSFQVLKPFFARMRPCYTLDSVRLLQDACGGNFGFPSNHAGSAFATLGVVLHFLPKASPAVFWTALAIAISVCLSRVYLGVHYPGDVVGGAIVGFSCSWVSMRSVRIVANFYSSRSKVSG